MKLLSLKSFEASDILYRDAELVAFNKAATVPCVGDKSGDLSVIDFLQEHLGGQLYPVHRLDRPVSGVVLFARSQKAAEYFGGLWRKGGVKRCYLAITEGLLCGDSGVLEAYLLKDSRRNKSYITSSLRRGAKFACLSYSLHVRTDNYWIYKIELDTGRHHQIRVQLSAENCPIKGDVKYGARRKEPDRSIGLHGYAVEFLRGTKRICIEAPLPEGVLWKLAKDAF